MPHHAMVDQLTLLAALIVFTELKLRGVNGALMGAAHGRTIDFC